MRRGDKETFLRVIYSLKQGNSDAEELLRGNESLIAIPYLMEDVAHGSLNFYGAHHPTVVEGRVRVAVVKSVSETLAYSPVFTGETRECLRAIRSGNESEIQTLTDQSRYLIQWWLLNENAFETGKWDEIRPLPQKISYIHPKDDIPFPPRDKSVYSIDPAQRPPIGGPEWELNESFEAWSARIVDPRRRNLDFVALSWDGKRVIEHPPVSLDPKAKPQDRESRKTTAPRNPPKPDSGDERNETMWVMVAVATVCVLSIVKWLRRRKATGI